MKIRIVVLSLIFVVAFFAAACGSETETVDEGRPKRETASPSPNQANFAVSAQLKKASTLLEEAKSELDQGTEDAQAKAKQVLGYPMFLVSDFSEPEGFISTLKKSNRGALSEYLVTNFEDPTKTLLDATTGDRSTAELLNALKNELNKQLQKKDLYVPSRFPKDRLTTDTINELARYNSGIAKFSPEELAYLNRRLLQDSYREFIKPARGETVLSHLQKAETLAKNLSASELPPKFHLDLSKTVKATRTLLREQAEDGETLSLSPSAVTAVTNDVNAVVASLERTNNDQAGGWFSGITQILTDVLYYFLLIAALLIPIALVAYLIKRARDNAAAKELANLQTFKKLIDRHDHLQQEFIAFKNQNGSDIDTLKDQISRLESGYRILSRKSEQLAYSSSGNTQSINRFYEPPPAPIKEEPEFPVSAETYLQRMKGSNRPGTVIRPDFQNGILVKDADGRGELVLVENSAGPVDFQRLFVVPSVSQFQMKQDFYNYYDGYYECDQPTAGDVWIVHPAIVEKVSGGWRLTEKGRLEVR